MRELTKNRELVIFYNSHQHLDKLILAYVRSHVNKLREVDISLTTLTNVRIQQLADALELPLSKMVNKRSTYYPNYEKHVLAADDFALMQVFCYNETLLRTPILVSPEKAMIAEGISDVLAFLNEQHSEMLETSR